jgi:DNA-binding winged helix-turn-helix (wHTH) protein
MFLINNRFIIDPASNSCYDKSNDRRLRLEPRIMQLLCLLSEQPGKVMSRETLVNIIWKDYGGGDEGLTQGISVLRKALSDEEKQMIQTLPKKGYSFTGIIGNLEAEHVVQITKVRAKKKRKILWFAAAVVLFAIIISSVFITKKNTTGNIVPYPADMAKQAASEENNTNSISTKDKDNITYRLVIIDDRPPVFYREDKMIPVSQWEPYQDMINYLKTELGKKKKK